MTVPQRSAGDRYEFSAAEVRALLDELDVRLQHRGAAAAVFVVGGAAIAASGVRGGRLTEDVDAVSDQADVFEVAAAIAAERGLPSTWLNGAARMWMPPLPPGVLDPPPAPGLRVTFADDAFLFATKLVAQRARDASDLLALADRLQLRGASPAALEAHIRRYYDDEESLALVVGGEDASAEVGLLAADAARLLASPRSGPR